MPTGPPSTGATVLPGPYAPVEKVRLVTPGAERSAAYSVRVRRPDGSSHEAGVVSDAYLLVENERVRDLACEAAYRSGLGFTEERVFWDGKRYSLFLAARERGLIEVAPGDAVGLGIAFSNSYDGSQRLAASLYVLRLACSNGMVAPELFRRATFRHVPAGQHWEAEVARALSVLDAAHVGLARFAEACRALKGMRLTASRLREVRRGPLASVPVTLWGQVLDRMLEHERLDDGLYALLNAATAETWHAEKATAATYRHNEAATTGLVRYALGAERLN